jgi:hypothetical protein
MEPYAYGMAERMESNTYKTQRREFIEENGLKNNFMKYLRERGITEEEYYFEFSARCLKQEFIIEEKNKSKLSYDEVIKKIEELTGFSMYKSFNLNLNKEKKKIEGVYFQYDKGCILYSLINEGWLDEKYSMKFYKNHNYLKDKRENFYLIN